MRVNRFQVEEGPNGHDQKASIASSSFSIVAIKKEANMRGAHA